ncbi:MAG: CBS domain-containing protein [Magnetococcales bacterium]|nr:CBS domain-containing protein [Magnetococcales bacterium]
MPSIPVPDEVVVKARPFFLNYFSKLAKDLNTLTAAPVSCSLNELTVLMGRSRIESLFEADRSVGYVKEDGQNTGDLHIVIDVETSIALTGLMMMMGEGVIREQVKAREYSEEIHEGFHEVVNQVVGSMNELVERKLKGGHLFLDQAKHVQYGEVPPSMQDETLYLDAEVNIQVSNFAPQAAHWILSQGFIEALLGVEFPSLEEMMGEEAAGRMVPSKAKKAGPMGVDLSGYANVGVDPSLYDKKLDLSGYEGELGDDGKPKGGPVDLSAYASGDKEKRFSADDGLPLPNAPGGVSAVMSEVPLTLKEEDKVIKAIHAMRVDGYKFIGVNNKDGKLVKMLTQSDLRQIMGPFFGTKAMSERDKAICTVPLEKINREQQLIKISTEGTINQVADLLVEFEVRAIPVISKAGILRGFVTAHAVLDYFRKKK